MSFIPFFPSPPKKNDKQKPKKNDDSVSQGSIVILLAILGGKFAWILLNKWIQRLSFPGTGTRNKSQMDG